MIVNDLIGQVKEIANSEEFHTIDKKHNYRYERKFTVPNEFSLKSISCCIEIDIVYLTNVKYFSK